MITIGSVVATLLFGFGVTVTMSDERNRADWLTATMFFAMAVVIWAACLYGEFKR